MRNQIISRRSTLQFEGRLLGLVVVLTPEHLEETVGSNANEGRLCRVRVTRSHGGNPVRFKCIVGPLCTFDSRGIHRIELETLVSAEWT
jgi:hypothetical protein